MTNLRAFLTPVVLLALTVSGYAQVLTPISVTGFNLQPYFSTTPGDTTGSGDNFQSFNFVVAGWNGPGSNGTPLNGLITSDGNPNATFQLAPYNVDNVLTLLNSNGTPSNISSTGTLTLTTPAAFSDLSFLVTNAGTGGMTATFNFADGSHAVNTIGTLPYWVFGDATPSGGIEASYDLQIYQNTNVQLTEYDFAVPTADQGKLLDSVTFAYTTDTAGDGPGGALGIFALSGTATVPEPSTWALGAAGFALLGWLLRRQALSAS